MCEKLLSRVVKKILSCVRKILSCSFAIYKSQGTSFYRRRVKFSSWNICDNCNHQSQIFNMVHVGRNCILFRCIEKVLFQSEIFTSALGQFMSSLCQMEL